MSSRVIHRMFGRSSLDRTPGEVAGPAGSAVATSGAKTALRQTKAAESGEYGFLNPFPGVKPETPSGSNPSQIEQIVRLL